MAGTRPSRKPAVDARAARNKARREEHDRQLDVDRQRYEQEIRPRLKELVKDVANRHGHPSLRRLEAITHVSKSRIDALSRDEASSKRCADGPELMTLYRLMQSSDLSLDWICGRPVDRSWRARVTVGALESALDDHIRRAAAERASPAGQLNPEFVTAVLTKSGISARNIVDKAVESCTEIVIRALDNWAKSHETPMTRAVKQMLLPGPSPTRMLEMLKSADEHMRERARQATEGLPLPY